jgi:hypothetical protein
MPPAAIRRRSSQESESRSDRVVPNAYSRSTGLWERGLATWKRLTWAAKWSTPMKKPNMSCYLAPIGARHKTKALTPVDFSIGIRAFKWSGRQDLNLRPLAPQASALPGCATPRKRLNRSMRRAPSASLTRDRQAGIANDDLIRRLLRHQRRGCRRDLPLRSLPRGQSRRSSRP